MPQAPATGNVPPASLSFNGLSEDEAAGRLRSEGYNELVRNRKRDLFRITVEVCSEPMFELLLAASAIYFVLGDIGEALILVGSAITTVVVAVVQEHRTERVLEALRDLTSPRAWVIRGGISKRIPGREVVRGDIIVLAEGDRVPADAILLSCSDLQADESLLTGESVPVQKSARNAGVPENTSIGLIHDQATLVHSGTMIVRGHGVGEVFATGPKSEIGKIGERLGEIVLEPSLLQRQVRRLVRTLAAIGIGLSLLVVALYVLMHGSWLDGMLAGITLAMSLLPEEFPLVLTIFLVMGAWRISKAHVLTRRSATIETLGAATVLCSDKTGTLTVNRMTIAELFADGETLQLNGNPKKAGPLSDKFLCVIEYGVLASEAHPFDPMERAFHDLGQKLLTSSGRLHPDWTLAHEYGLSPQLLAVTHVWKPVVRQPDSAAEYVVAAKGAPEAVARLCGLNGNELKTILMNVDAMAARGMRVLAVASSLVPGPPWPKTPSAFRFDFLGLVGLADPLRPGVPEAVSECHRAGIRVVMVTGDYPATAKAIGRQAGLDVAGGVVSGGDLARMSDVELRDCAKRVRVFARTLPDHKLLLVNAFKANGEIVAMTGDGVNDAPSLKAAHIGIAMGGRGTDVAREASAIVLLDDDFSSVVQAVRLGRRIYDNLLKAMGYLLAVHVPIAGLSLLPIIRGWPLIFAPVHIAFLELVIDPVASVVFEAEAEETDIMHKPPRLPQAPLFSRRMIGWSIFQGAWVFLLTAGVLAEAVSRNVPDSETRALTFISLVTCNLLLIFVNRSFSASIIVAFQRPNPALWLVLAATATLLALSLYVPAIRSVFAFNSPNAADFVRVLLVAVATIAFLEPVKATLRSRRPTPE
jgi:Ca2+-transporting ATPase